MSKLYDRLDILETRLKELEDWTRTDETLIKNRLDEILKVCLKEDNKIENDLIALQLKIEKLESLIKTQHDHHSEHCLVIEELKTKFDAILTKSHLNNIKIPFKCPVCEGTCMRPNPLVSMDNAKMPVNLDCIVCGGQGVIWG